MGSLFGKSNSMPLYRAFAELSRTLAEQDISGCNMVMHVPRRLIDALRAEVLISDRAADGFKFYLHNDITITLREKKAINSHAHQVHPQDAGRSSEGPGEVAEGIRGSSASEGEPRGEPESPGGLPAGEQGKPKRLW